MSDDEIERGLSKSLAREIIMWVEEALAMQVLGKKAAKEQTLRLKGQCCVLSEYDYYKTMIIIISLSVFWKFDCVEWEIKKQEAAEAEHHKLGARSASGLEELIMGCTSSNSSIKQPLPVSPLSISFLSLFSITF